VAARRAHNPKVDGSNPSAATNANPPRRNNILLGGFLRFMFAYTNTPGMMEWRFFCVLAVLIGL
jgi:hypothetical protein